jgi:hypothetical protein
MLVSACSTLLQWLAIIERRTLDNAALNPEDSTIKMRASSGCLAKYKMNVSTASLI